MSTTSSTALFLFFITICTFSSKCLVQVRNSRAPVLRTENQPLTLKCTAEYDEQHFRSIVVSWCFKPTISTSTINCQPLIDPDLYSLHINESKISEKRQRDAFITFEQLTLSNTGFYQCKAKCSATGTSAIGHVINVTVTGDPNKGQKIPSCCNRCDVNMILLTISVIFWTIKCPYFTK
ncbi:uncharacterized protein zgc:174945 [Silurus meridionalis]|uniref:uncharacterized protein zgc:174945 n=1 Tax=Silurus meridionalis TaxID=175797 RepID=UPI001EEC6F7F|nr:uncharacterized protein zgc:174945 [Silurus meridionalis]